MKKYLITGVAALMLTACGSSTSQQSASPAPDNIETTTTAQNVVVDNRSKSEDNVSVSESEAEKDTKEEPESAAETEQPAKTETTTETTAEKEPEPVKKELSDEDFSYKGYLYTDSLGKSRYYIIATNNSDQTASVSISGIAKDGSGNSIGADDAEIDVIGPGETSIAMLYFMSAEGVASVDYTTTFDTSPWYKPVVGALSTSQTVNNKNVIVEVTNNGDIPAEFVEGYALFFDADGNVVRGDSTYFTDNDSEIKPGASITKELSSFHEFDHVEVYFTGRGGH